ncbi:MAG: hypothetical protein JSR58_06590 [Verrucomicrobia bacterium]|nr:hypothetical protein [Verrucomicrobiota bacterium]
MHITTTLSPAQTSVLTTVEQGDYYLAHALVNAHHQFGHMDLFEACEWHIGIYVAEKDLPTAMELLNFCKSSIHPHLQTLYAQTIFSAHKTFRYHLKHFQFKKAENCLNLLIDHIKDPNPTLRCFRAFVCYMQSQLDKAKEDLVQVPQHQSKFEELITAMAQAFINRNEYQQAILMLSPLCKKENQCTHFFRWRAIAYQSSGDNAAALKDVEEGLTIDPSDTVLQIFRKQLQSSLRSA